ncbi:MAG: alkaline phosphatase [Candidatus Hodarchaeales archaeon]
MIKLLYFKLDSKKITLSFIFMLMLTSLVMTKSAIMAGDVEQESSVSNPLSVILMIGDGMGFEHVKLTRWVEFGVSSSLNMEFLPISGEVTTRSLDSTITDSAAAATAIATSVKTNNRMLSILPNGTELKTILEEAKEIGKSTGIITTTEVTHATPAAFYSHVNDRGSYSEIARQLVEEANVDVIMGGGKSRFSTAQLDTMESRGYAIVETRTQLQLESSNKILGLFASGALPYERNRDRSSIPSLAEMTQKSLEILSEDSDGFFLMVEGGQIDWAAHANNAENVVLETVEFDRAVAEAIQYVNTHGNTILIVTADHETGGLTVITNDFKTELPDPENTDEENEELRIARTNEVVLFWSTDTHTRVNVPFYILGKNLDLYNGTIIDNTQIFQICYEHFYSDSGCPLITIESPLNATYSAPNVMFRVLVNESVEWIKYSINDGSNETMENFEINLTLGVGSYRLKVFAQDNFGNIGSNKVFFTVTENQSTDTTTTVPNAIASNTPGFAFIIAIAVLPIIFVMRNKKD